MNQDNQNIYKCNFCGFQYSLANGDICPNCQNKAQTVLNTNQLQQPVNNAGVQQNAMLQQPVNNVGVQQNAMPQQPVNNVGIQQNAILQQPDYQQNQAKEKISISSIVLFILSLLNIAVLKFVVAFLAVFIIFGALTSSDFVYSAVVYGCFGYFAASAIAPIAFIINMVKKGKILKKCLLVIFISFIIGAIFLPGYYKASKATNYSPEKAKVEKNKLTDKVVYDQDGVKITQKRIEYNASDITVYFTVESQDANSVKVDHYISTWVNNCLITSPTTEKTGEPNEYRIKITYSQLSEYDIDSLNTIDTMFNIHNKQVRVTMTLDGKEDKTIEKNIRNAELLYSNEYFKLYLANDSKHRVRFFIESLTSDEYELFFDNVDLNTQGYINSIRGERIYPHSFYASSISFYPCEINMTYIKFDYILSDRNYNDVKKDHVELKFDAPKIDKRYCAK